MIQVRDQSAMKMLLHDKRNNAEKAPLQSPLIYSS